MFGGSLPRRPFTLLSRLPVCSSFLPGHPIQSASFYLCDRQHALAGLRSLRPFLAAGGRLRLFSPLSTLGGGGGGGGEY